ncbi:MAG: MFS transporter [Thermoplasmata archaeon]
MLFGYRRFTLLFSGSIASTFGVTISTVVIAWYVFYQTHNPIDIAYLGIAGFAPTVLFGLLGGAFADRGNRRHTMILCDLARAIAISAIPVSILFFGFNLWVILASVFLVDLFSSVFRPASSAFLPQILPESQLEQANGISFSGITLVQILANAVGAALLVAFGTPLALFINSATYLISALFLYLISPVSGHTNSDQKETSLRGQLKEGLRYVSGDTGLLQLVLTSTIINFFATMLLSFLVVFSSLSFSGSALAYGALLTMLGAGYALGGVIAGRLHPTPIAGKVIIACDIIMGASLVPLALFPNIVLSSLILLIVGTVSGVVYTTFLSTVQIRVPNDLIGRVLSIDEVGSFAVVPVSQIFTGLFILRFGVYSSILLASAGILIVGLVEPMLPKLREFKAPLETTTS